MHDYYTDNPWREMFTTLHYVLIKNLPWDEYEKIMDKFEKEYEESIRDGLLDEE